MLRKLIIIIGFSLLVLFIQVLVAPLISIQDIRPDFILILVIIIGQLLGRALGQVYGFSIGLIVDAIGLGSFLGLSALTKLIAGFLSGYLKDRRKRINIFSFYLIIFTIICLHFLIFYLIYFQGSGHQIQYIILRYVIPSSLYTSVFYFLVDYFLPIKID